MGLFISLEGIDGCGKSTLGSKLQHQLQELFPQKEVLLSKEPGGTPIGKPLREILLHPPIPLAKVTELLLFLADRGQHVADKIQPAIDQGNIIITDRYADSTIVYQSLCGWEPSFLEKLHADLNLPWPEITFLLDLTPEKAQQRLANRKGKSNHYDEMAQDKLQTMYDHFHLLAKTHKNRFVILDAIASPDSLLDQAMLELTTRGLI